MFSELGYDGTSVRKICEEADVSLALVSYHFGGKENVFFAILESLREVPFLPNTNNPAADLRNYLAVLNNFLNKDQNLLQIVRQEFVMFSPRAEKIIPIIHILTNKLKSILEDGRNKGVFHYASLHNAMFFVLGSIVTIAKSGVLYAIINNEVKNEPNEVSFEDLYDFILKGLGAQ